MTVLDFAALSPSRRYKLAVSAIVPRPIAWVSTVSAEGKDNLAPFSFFNAICDEPVAVVLGVNSTEHRQKDTAENVRSTGEFVVNLVDEASAPQMNLSSTEHPPGASELDIYEIASCPSTKVAPRTIESAPVGIECCRIVGLELSPGRNIIVGQVVALHIRDDLFDADSMHIRTPDAKIIGRMHGSGWYVRTADLFHMSRPVLQ